jgi:parvulin-like peptidyl-prolyl isomerase
MPKESRQNKELTKKQIAVSRHDKQQRNRVLMGLGAVAALVLGIAIVGLVDQLVIKPSRPVAVVGDARVRTDEYQGRVRYERFLMDSFLQQVQFQLAQLDPEDPSTSFLSQYYQQIASQTQQQRLGVDSQTVYDMVEERLVRQKAAEVGLTVSEEELNEAVRARIAGMSGAATEKQATEVASTAVAATATAQTFTATPEPTATQEIPTPQPTPTLHIITDEEFTQDYQDYLGVIQEQTGLTEAEYRRIVEGQLLATKVYDYYADQVPAEAEQVNMRHIKLDTEEAAQAALDRLEAGEDFALVASEVSTDTLSAEEGGELGWFIKDELEARYGAEVAEAAFSLEPGKPSQPIQGLSGWHIVQVDERAVRPLTELQLSVQQRQAYSDWLEGARSSDAVQILWEPDMAPPDPLFEGSAGLPPGGLPIGQTDQ